MTISQPTLKSNDPEPARRFKVFTGSGRRREWLPEKKARIVAESYDDGEDRERDGRAICIISTAVIRLAPLRASAIGECAGTEPMFVPAVCATGVHERLADENRQWSEQVIPAHLFPTLGRGLRTAVTL